MPIYEWEWLSDLAIIPAWECFLLGVILGLSIGVLLFIWRDKK